MNRSDLDQLNLASLSERVEELEEEIQKLQARNHSLAERLAEIKKEGGK